MALADKPTSGTLISNRDTALAAEDEVILDRASQENRVIVSADTDFGALLSQRQDTKPPVVLFRGATPRRPAGQTALLLANLPSIDNHLSSGAVVVIEPGRLRIRSLPIV